MPKNRVQIGVVGTRGIPDVMGGIETHCKELYPRLTEFDYRITLIARKGYTPTAKPYLYKGVKVVPVFTFKHKHLEALFHTFLALVKLRLSGRYDVLHIHGIGPALLTPLAKAMGFTTVVTHHGADYNRKKWGYFAKTVLKLGERFACKYSDAVISVSRNTLADIKLRHHHDGTYIPNGVPAPVVVPAGSYLQKLALFPQKYILSVGRLVPEKGFHDLLEAFRELDTDWKLVIAGDADHEDSYSLQLKASALKDNRLIMPGRVIGNELAELYSNAGLFVLPSYHEGLPITLLEALSYGLPVIASNIPANIELIAREQSFSPGDIGSLRMFLKKAVTSPMALSVYRSRLGEEFSWESVAEHTSMLYQEVLARQGEGKTSASRRSPMNTHSI